MLLTSLSSILHRLALNSLFRADVPLRSYSVTHHCAALEAVVTERMQQEHVRGIVRERTISLSYQHYDTDTLKCDPITILAVATTNAKCPVICNAQ